MPYVNIQITRGATREQKAQLGAWEISFETGTIEKYFPTFVSFPDIELQFIPTSLF